MRPIISFLILLFIFQSCKSNKQVFKNEQKRPNIIYIMADDHATQAISAYGHPISKLAPTPNIDRISNEGALFKKKTTSNGTRGTNPNPGGNSNGPDAGKIGDKGSPNGKINNSTNYSGNGGSGEGSGSSSVNIAGWRIANRPNVKDDTGETGMIRFTIKIDEDGNIIKLVIAENSFSNSLAHKYKRAIEKSKFIKKSSGPSPKEATGSITFRVGER